MFKLVQGTNYIWVLQDDKVICPCLSLWIALAVVNKLHKRNDHAYLGVCFPLVF
jgi:hypothetical protein